MNRIHNFSAGPTALPLEVLEKASEEFVDYNGSGTSIIEKSHRGADYVTVDAHAREQLIKILNLGDDYDVLFLQGGASTQFLSVPYNFLSEGETADYINTGAWSTKAIKEAKFFGNVNEAFSSADSNFNYVPTNDQLNLTPDAKYVHFTSNNTIFGTQFATEPETNGVKLVCDASSDFLSRPIDISKYGVIYAGAQKNLGPAGVTVVIVNKEYLAATGKSGIPTMMNYNTHAGKMFNTPPVFAVYMVGLVLDWIQDKGGLEYFESFNKNKAALLYNEIDADDFYVGTAENASRSNMNVCFRISDEELEAKFIGEATANKLDALKGHRSVGGIRASIYNACPQESVEALVSFMKEFRAKNG
ncbi:MAG: 3-phosphoserine/phosphohydroxythreonine transaminase [Balneolaceae bacterium]